MRLRAERENKADSVRARSPPSWIFSKAAVYCCRQLGSGLPGGVKPAGNARDVLALKAAHVELERSGHAQFRSSARNAAGTVRRSPRHFAHRRNAGSGVWKSDDDHPVM